MIGDKIVESAVSIRSFFSLCIGVESYAVLNSISASHLAFSFSGFGSQVNLSTVVSNFVNSMRRVLILPVLKCLGRRKAFTVLKELAATRGIGCG